MRLGQDDAHGVVGAGAVDLRDDVDGALRGADATGLEAERRLPVLHIAKLNEEVPLLIRVEAIDDVPTLDVEVEVLQLVTPPARFGFAVLDPTDSLCHS